MLTKKTILFRILSFLLLLQLLPAQTAPAIAAPASLTKTTQAVETPSLLQFTSGGHILGFTSTGMVAATGSHALHVDFVGAKQVQPQASSSESSGADTQAAPLSRVTYTDLWPGISLAYTASAGSIYTTTYSLTPGAEAKNIRLHYNTPIKLTNNGGLSIAFETGTLTESGPIAWQDIEGRHVNVDVSFHLNGQEVSFHLGAYNPLYPLTIDPDLTWNTFLGGNSTDKGGAIEIDNNTIVSLAPTIENIPCIGPFPHVFYTNTVNVLYPGGPMVLSSAPGGGGDLITDDEVNIQVTRPDGTTATYNHVYGYPVNPEFVVSTPPVDIANLFQVGDNLVEISLIDNIANGCSTKGYYLTYTLKQLNINNGMSASLVLGQPDFFTNSTGVSTQTGMSGPYSVAVDPTSGKVFVADANNNRVLRFGSLANLTNGAAAEAVLGQSNFTSNMGATTQSRMRVPVGVTVDANGRLYVVDNWNNRVLRFDNAASLPSGSPADGVLGQPNFSSQIGTISQNGMADPQGVAVDQAGRLWVAISGNHRVLRFDDAASLPNGANANGVLGQPDFTSGDADTTQSGMYHPTSVAVDIEGRLWVADAANNRVLRFDSAASLPNGANASGVLGQVDFTSKNSLFPPTQSSLVSPYGVAVDLTGRLYVTDSGNSRVLSFFNAASKPNGGNADNVLGHTDFVSSMTGSPTSTNLNAPNHIFYDPAMAVLWLVDAGNHRVLMYGGYTFSGTLGANGAGANVAYTGGMVTADSTTGDYSFLVAPSWTGMITPSKPGYTFTPASINVITPMTTDLSNQNFVATLNHYTISGNAGVEGVNITYTGGITTTDGVGNYSFSIPYDWSGIVTPTKTGYTFSPESKNYSNVTVDKTNEDYASIQNEYTLVITSAQGTVAKNPDKATYTYGEIVQLTATPAAGWSFSNWTGDLISSLNPDSVTIHGNTSVTANYSDAPGITSLYPTSATAGAPAFTLTIHGANFVNGATVQWNGVNRTTTFVNNTQLTAEIPEGDLAVGVADITVLNPAPGGGTSNPWPFFITQTGTGVTNISIATGTNPTVTNTFANVSANTTGTGTVAVAQYVSNPGGAPTYIPTGQYFDVHLSGAFTSVTINICGLAPGITIYFWTGSAWVAASNQSYDASSGCVTVTVSDTTIPNLADMGGAIFGEGTAEYNVFLPLILR